MDARLIALVVVLIVVDVALTVLIVKRRRSQFPLTLKGKLLRTAIVPALLIGGHAAFQARSFSHAIEYGVIMLGAWLVVTWVAHLALRPRALERKP